jgi:hypothetical protein
MIIAEMGVAPDIQLWRGDISACFFNLRLVNTMSGEVTHIEGLRDMTPTRHTIQIIPKKDVWEALPNGEYEYYIEHEGSILASGLLKNIKPNESYEYDTGSIYTEYRE